MAEKKYIEREAAIADLELYEKEVGKNQYALVIAGCRSHIRHLPIADVRPVVRGKWIDEPIKGVRYHCSVCQGRFDYTWHYCPNCGADMRGIHG